MKLFKLAVLAVTMAASSFAAEIYDNTSTDTLITYFYSTGPYTQIGDQVALVGTDRTLTDASVQFYNNGGSNGTFSATLSFFNVGSPVGTQLGSSYVLNNIAINAEDILTVTFSNLDLAIPGNSLIFTVAVLNVSSGLDLGLNAFDPPSAGSSSSDSIIVNKGSSFLTGTTAGGQGNLYFQLNATTPAAVPEPSTLSMLGGAMLAGTVLLKRRKK